MEIFNTRQSISEYLSQRQAEKLRIGFVPTMGALHNGHLSLLEAAKRETDLVVCSIFVNPTQFNDPADLEKYPRPAVEDTQKLRNAGCDVLFLPSVGEMYPEGEHWHMDLGGLDGELEGARRPGHYQGVTQIVKKLFDIVKPDIAFFGQKDYQQFLAISKLVTKFKIKTRLVMCPIVRESDGLAMSSRNVHLQPAERQQALALSGALEWVRNNFTRLPLSELISGACSRLECSPGVEMDYFDIRKMGSLRPASGKRGHLIALVAARVGNTRLIDNVILS